MARAVDCNPKSRVTGRASAGIAADCSALQPYLVFPGEYVAPERVTHTVDLDSSKRPLFILLDATQAWTKHITDEAALALLADPQWQPYLVFPGEYVAPERVTHSVEMDINKRPLFILLDATWTEARKIFRKSPYFDALPILSLLPEKLSRYRLRRSTRSEHLCTAEVASLCLDLAGDSEASSALDAYFDVFSQHYLDAKNQLPMMAALLAGIIVAASGAGDAGRSRRWPPAFSARLPGANCLQSNPRSNSQRQVSATSPSTSTIKSPT